jgi:hypothetical protein
MIVHIARFSNHSESEFCRLGRRSFPNKKFVSQAAADRLRGRLPEGEKKRKRQKRILNK